VQKKIVQILTPGKAQAVANTALPFPAVPATQAVLVSWLVALPVMWGCRESP